MGLSLIEGRIAAGFATDEDYRVFVAVGDEPPRELYRQRGARGGGERMAARRRRPVSRR